MARKAALSGAKPPKVISTGGVSVSKTANGAKAMRDKALLRAATRHGAEDDGARAAEAQVAAEFTEGVTRVREELHNAATGATTRMLKLGARLDVARADEAGVRAKLEIANARAEHRDDLIAAEREVMAAERDLRLFRMQNKLTREPAIPRDQIVSGAWLAVILVLEAAFNTPFFLIEGQSLIGASFEGLLVSGANVGLGLMAGMVGLRMASHNQLFPWKISGLLTFLGSLAAAVALGALMALRRINEAASSESGAIIGDLSPMVLTVAFTAFSAMGFIFAAYKGWQGFFEPYPGYGQTAKRLWTARRRLEDLRHDFHAAARQAIQAIQTDLDEEIDADRDAVDAARHLMTEVEQIELNAKYQLDDLRMRAEHLVRIYRETTAHAEGGDTPSMDDISARFTVEVPQATRARKALEDAEKRLDENERAYGKGLADLRQVLLNLEHDLAVSVAEAQATARSQRAKEIEQEEGKSGAPRPSGPAPASSSAGSGPGAAPKPARDVTLDDKTAKSGRAPARKTA